MSLPPPVRLQRHGGAPRYYWRRAIRCFLRGLLIVAPVAVTAVALRWVFLLVDGILRPWLPYPGLGVVVMLAVVWLVGLVSSFFVVDQGLRVFDRWLERTPGVSFIYSSVRDFVDAFVGRKRRFTRAVLVNVFADDVWLVGFLTDEALEKLGLGGEFVAVYVPQGYNVAGQLYLVHRSRVRAIEGLGAAEAMKYTVSGGAVAPVAAAAPAESRPLAPR